MTVGEGGQDGSEKCPSRSVLRNFIVGDLPFLLQESIARHVEGCDACGSVLGSLDDSDDELIGILQGQEIADEPVPADVFRLVIEAMQSPRGGAVSEVITSSQSTPAGERFRILRRHAGGGLGVVFVAEDDELHREVALKEIRKRYANDPRSRSRFIREAEITSKLEHPGIVPVYGLGHHAGGRPYYAMRLVRGDRLKDAIAEYHRADRAGRSPGERAFELRRLLGQFVDACNAVAYAHSQGVLHRDLKPSNIMIGPFGETLVVDWGMAKYFGRPDEVPVSVREPTPPTSVNVADETLPGSPIGTLQYASPEQVDGRLDEVGPTSDVYSLGATLYCVLTGRPPFPDPSGGEEKLVEIRRMIRQGDFPRPRDVRSDLPKALEAVCLKAMATRPSERYPSPSTLAEDVERWMADEPVSALTERWYQRSARWMRRHRAATRAGAISLVIIALVSTAAALFISRSWARERRALDRAERRADLALRAIENFRKAVTTELDVQNRPDLKSLRKKLLGEPLEFYRQLRQDIQGSGETLPEMRAKLAKATLELAAITAEIDSQPNAIQAFQEGIGLLDSLASDEPADREHRVVLGRALGELGMLQRAAGKTTEARDCLDRALGIQGALVRLYPAASYQADLSRTLDRLGLLAISTRPDEARVNFERAIGLQRKLLVEDQSVSEHRNTLALYCNHLGMVSRALGRVDAAQASFQEAIEALDVLSSEHPDVPRYRSLLASVHHNLGNLRIATGRPEARESFERAREIHETLVNDYPSVSSYRADLASACGNLSVMERGTKPEEARVSLGRARDLLEGLVRDNPSVMAYRSDLALTYINLGAMESDAQRLDEAVATYEKARSLLQLLIQADPESLKTRRAMVAACDNLGFALAGLGRDRDATGAFRDAVGQLQFLFVKAPPGGSERGALIACLRDLAEAHRKSGRAAEAAGVARELRDLWTGDPGEMYDIACQWALCVPIADQDSTSGKEKAVRRRVYADQAMGSLRQAVAAGFKDFELMRRDADLDPLRSHADFREFLMDLGFPSNPFAR